MAKKYKMVVFTSAADGRDEDFNDWYQNTHLKQLVGIKSIVSAQRFRFNSNIVPGSEDPPRYLAIYEIETDDIATVLRDMNELAASGRMPLPDSMGPQVIGAAYEEFGEVVKT